MKQLGEEIGNNPAKASATRIRATQEKLAATLQGQFNFIMRRRYVWFGYCWKACGESRGEGTA